MGDLTSSFCHQFGSQRDYTEEIKELPCSAWQGTVETNSIWIDVLPVGTSKSKKSP
jgi:hypothetical protein